MNTREREWDPDIDPTVSSNLKLIRIQMDILVKLCPNFPRFKPVRHSWNPHLAMANVTLSGCVKLITKNKKKQIKFPKMDEIDKLTISSEKRESICVKTMESKPIRWTCATH